VRLARSFPAVILGVLGTLASASELGCSAANAASGGSGSGEDDVARVDVVQAALLAPTGTVSSLTAKALLPELQAFQRVQPAFEALLLVGSGASPSCLSGSPEVGAYDLSCATGGQIVGRLTFESHGTSTDGGFQGTVDARLENACVSKGTNEGAGNDCVNAQAVIDVVPGDCAALATLAVSATISGADGSNELSFGVQGGVGRGQLMPHVAYFDSDGSSYTIDGAGQTAMPGPFLVTGQGHSFECTFAGSGGQCSGPTTFSF
jgi:hypothetical protein